MDFLLPQTQVLIWTIIVFLTLLGLLWKFAWGPLMRALEERQQRIQQKIDDANARSEAALQKVAEYEERLRNIEDEGRKVIEEARKDAEQTTARIQADARAEIDRQVSRLRREIDLARDKAADELQSQVVEMAVTIVEKVLEEQVSEDEHRRFVDDCITKYENMKL